MQGLIYKEIFLFAKSAEKRLLLIAAVVIGLLIWKGGIYSGLMASVMLSLTASVQSINSFVVDEKAEWKRYQRALPVSDWGAVAGKYVAVLLILLPCVAGSLVFSLASSLIYNCWNGLLWGLSALAALLVPLVWCAVCLPLTYWFGFRAGQTMAMICVFPMVYFIKFFEDGPGLSGLPEVGGAGVLASCLACGLLFAASYFLSVMGYGRKK